MRVFFEASGASEKRSMIRGSMSARPTMPTAAIGTMRPSIPSFRPCGAEKNERTNVTKNETGTIASAPREYVRTMQTVAATNPATLSKE